MFYRVHLGLFFLIVFSVTAFFLSYVLPNHYFPWVVAYQEFLSFLGAILLILIYLLCVRVVFVTPSVLFFFLLALVPLFQLAVGVIYFSGDAWVAAVYIASFSLMLLVGYGFGREPMLRMPMINLVAAVFLCSGVLSVWIALRQWLLLSGSIWVVDLPSGTRPFANMAQPNNFSTLLCLAVVATIYFYEKYIIGRFSASVLAAFLVFGIALAQSRTPWVGCIAIFVFWAWKVRVYSARLPLRSLFAWLVLYWACVAMLPLLAESLYLFSLDPLERARSLERWALWYQLWQAVLGGPVWGYGWNQVSVAQVAISLDYPVPIMVEHSHNFLLDLLLWNGPLLGGVVILCLSFWLMRLGWRARSAESLFCLLGSGFILVHGLLEFPLEYAFFLLPLGLMLGAVEGEQFSQSKFALSKIFIGGVVLFSIGLFGWVWNEYRTVEEDHRLMRFETSGIGSLKADQPAPNVVVLTQLKELLRFIRTYARAGMSAEELAWMRKVAHRYPYPSSVFRYSLALGLNGQQEAACEQLRVLRALHGDKHYDEGMRALQQVSVEYPQLEPLLQVMATENSLQCN